MNCPRSLLLALGLVLLCPIAHAADAMTRAFRFQFGAERPTPGFGLVAPTTVYAADRGFGFEPGATPSAVTQPASANPLHAGAVTTTTSFLFSVRVPEGNYRVTVTLGHPTVEATTTVKAETRRLMLEKVHTAPGEFVTRTFTVNVRGPKLASGGEVLLDSREMDLATHTPIARHWDDKLTIGFSGTPAAVAALEIERVENVVTLFLTGDSTVTDQPVGGSWGQMVTRWFNPEIAVANHAESGETLKGFLKEHRWEKLLEAVKPGDYVLIEFGTNDSKSKGPQNIYPGQDFSETYAPAETTYKELLRRFVKDARERGAQPLIASPSARRGEAADPSSLAAWAKAALEVAQELGVPAINLNEMGVQLNRALGADADKQFADRTHHTEYGAYLQAKCIVRGIRASKLPLAKFIVADFGSFDPEHPEPTPDQFSLPRDK